MPRRMKFNLVQKDSTDGAHCKTKNIRWARYLAILGLTGFILVLILANIKSRSYYQARKRRHETFLSPPDASSRLPPLSCQVTKCVATCSGDMTTLNKYLSNQKTCTSMKLYVNECFFPEDRIQSNWLEGTFNLSEIQIKRCQVDAISNGAFNHKAFAYTTQLVLNVDNLHNLNEGTFSGLTSLSEITLTNKVEGSFGEGFLKPVSRTLTKVQIEHKSNVATDPASWILGDRFRNLKTVVLDHSNFGDYIKKTTFQHLEAVEMLFLNSCNITYIEDGAFDFIARRPLFFYVSLQNNKLKHLDGNYLTKVSVLKTVDIQGNPWDCTCKLETLIREYKRSPDYFGLNSKCKTPSDLRGHTLNTVDVLPCEVSTSSVTKSSTQLSSSSIEHGSTTTTRSYSTSTATSTSADFESTTTSFSSTSTLNTSATTQLTTNSSSTSTDSFPETSSSSTSPLSTSTLDTPKDTSTSIQTTPSPHNRTTTLSADAIHVECESHASGVLPSTGHVELAPPDARFEILPFSKTSVHLRAENLHENLAIIWFSKQPGERGSEKYVRVTNEYQIGCQSKLDNWFFIENLTPSQAYTFCLVRDGAILVSPFNCRPYYIDEGELNINDNMDAWLTQGDKPLVISLCVLAIFLACSLSVVTEFVVLWYNPNLLKGSKRAVLTRRNNGNVLILPNSSHNSYMSSSYRDSCETELTTHQRRLSGVSEHSDRSYMVANNYEDVEYRWKANVVNKMLYNHRVPTSPPPPLPKRTSRNVSLRKCQSDNMDISVVHQKCYDYDYPVLGTNCLNTK